MFVQRRGGDEATKLREHESGGDLGNRTSIDKGTSGASRGEDDKEKASLNGKRAAFTRSIQAAAIKDAASKRKSRAVTRLFQNRPDLGMKIKASL
jgi:hypothetical protein